MGTLAGRLYPITLAGHLYPLMLAGRLCPLLVQLLLETSEHLKELGLLGKISFELTGSRHW